jgi:hypothetical protein
LLQVPELLKKNGVFLWQIHGAAGILEQLLQKHTELRALGGKSHTLVVDLAELRDEDDPDVTFAALKSMDLEELRRQLVLCADEVDWEFLLQMRKIKNRLPQSICLPMRNGVLVAVLEKTGERLDPIPVYKDENHHFGVFKSCSLRIITLMNTDTRHVSINQLLESTLFCRIFLFCEYLSSDKKKLSKIYCLRAAAVANGDNLHGDAYVLELMPENAWTFGLPPGWEDLGFHVPPPNGDYVIYHGMISGFISSKFSRLIDGRAATSFTSITQLFDRAPQVAENVIVLRQGAKGGTGKKKPRVFVLLVSRKDAKNKNTVEATHVHSNELTRRKLKWPVDEDGWDWGKNSEIVEP